MDLCGDCGEIESTEMVQCENCDLWFHYFCVNLSANIVAKINHYFCDGCESIDPVKFLTSWKCRRPNQNQLADKRKNYYVVESILNHRFKTVNGVRSRQFHIKWKGYSDTECTWEPEANLDGCLDLLQHYLISNDLPLSEVVGLLGAPSTSKINRKNWCRMEDILATFLKYKGIFFPKVELTVESWTSFKDCDGLYFLDHDRHCYVLLHLYERNLVYIVDGGNTFITNPDVSREIRGLINFRLKPLRYSQQTRVDYCASAGVLIALELVRAYRNNLFPKFLRSSTYFTNRVIKTMHKFESAPLQTPHLGTWETRLTCDVCGKTFRSNQKRNYSRHLYNHKRN